jgi:chromosomal replication initiator protein
MDDVQFLERKTRTEEEFFHTFNALHDGGRQIVLTSDRPPRDLQALEDRLRERFQAGLVADMTPPCLGTRLTILRMRAHHDNIELGDDAALSVIAERIESNVRALEGALIRVVAYASLRGERITAETVRGVLGRLPRPSSLPPRAATLEAIQTAAAEAFGLSRERLLARDRSPQVALARQVAMYLARELTNDSLPEIGRSFGRDHSTVVHAHKRVAADVAARGPASGTVDMLRERLASRAE